MLQGLLAGLLVVAALAGQGETPMSERLIASFETSDALQSARVHSARVTLVAERATAGKRALRVEFLPDEWPNVRLVTPKPWDWRGYGGLTLDLTNPGAEPIEFGVRVDDDPAADGNIHCRQGLGIAPPGKTITVTLPLGPGGMAYGMRGLPQPPGQRTLTPTNSYALDLSRIIAVQVFLHRPAMPKTLLLDNLRLTPHTLSLDKIVDPFGQYMGADWPGKLKAESEFSARRAAEEKELKAHPALPDRDRYGGWTKGPQLAATGWFRTEKVNGKWWLVTPEGRLFFSIGMDCVNLWHATIVTGRETMFAWLPPEKDPLAKHYGYSKDLHSGPVKEGKDFSFYTANLERKYGPDYKARWMETALERLTAWGFNTIANWSEEAFYDNRRVPFVATVHIGGNHARVSDGVDYWGKMHDPFDPQFAVSVANSLKAIAARVKDNPYCLGWFVDNELAWGWGSANFGLARGALSGAADSPAKRAFLEHLKAKYGEIGKLNAAWGTTYGDWNSLTAPQVNTQSPPALLEDLRGFLKTLARRYFQVVRDELKRLDPNHLYLGCRFAGSASPEVIEAAAEFCDVVSFNFYQPRLDEKAFAYLNQIGKPCIIGEFHFGALDRGMFHTGLVAAPDQATRAAMYQDYLRTVIDHPALVGCHWFQYVDQPLTGRALDGENYNVGFVTVTDTPYPEMVAAAKAVHAEAYSRRYGSQSAN
jgi:hypothetical protein